MTGDLRNYGTRLQSLLRSARYPRNVNYQYLLCGYSEEYLPVLHYIFQDFSLPFTRSLLKKGYQLSGKSDKQFLETIYKILRDEFGLVPKLTKERFLSTGYAEQKLILTGDVYKLIIDQCKKKKRPVVNSNKENCPDNIPLETSEKPCTTTDTIHKASLPEVDIQDTLHSSSDIEEVGIFSVADHTEEKVYSEAGAREVYALDHHLPEEEEAASPPVPRTTLARVEVLPLAGSPPEFTVVRGEEEEEEKRGGGCGCKCADELRQMKELLVTVNARLDILESKVKNSDPTSQRVPLAARPREQVITEPPKEVSAVVDDGDDDDIERFLRNVNNRLNSTRSFLRSYDTAS